MDLLARLEYINIKPVFSYMELLNRFTNILKSQSIKTQNHSFNIRKYGHIFSKSKNKIIKIHY